MEFQPEDPDKIRKLLEGHQSVLADKVAEDEKYYAGKACPFCGSKCVPLVDSTTPFIPGRLTPKCNLQCMSCGTLFEPDTGIVIEEGVPLDEVPDITQAELITNE